MSVAEDASSTSDPSTGSELDEEEECEDETALEESWIAWLERTARAIDVQIQKASVADWVKLQGAGHVFSEKG